MASTTRYEISHVSRCLYASPVRGCVMSLCLKPRDEPGQRLLRFEIATNPLSSMNSETDCFGNTKHVLNIHREHEALEIVALSAIETAATAPPSGSLGAGSWEEVRSWRDSLAYWDFMHASALARPSARLKDFVDRMDIRAAGDPLEALTGLSDALHRGFEYVPGSTSVASSIDHVLENGRGVCQDYSHVMIAIARSWGVPSRYVFGLRARGCKRSGFGIGVSRVGRVPVARPRLDWLRSHKRVPARRESCARRSGPRLPRRGSDPRRLAGRRGEPA